MSAAQAGDVDYEQEQALQKNDRDDEKSTMRGTNMQDKEKGMFKIQGENGKGRWWWWMNGLAWPGGVRNVLRCFQRGLRPGSVWSGRRVAAALVSLRLGKTGAPLPLAGEVYASPSPSPPIRGCRWS